CKGLETEKPDVPLHRIEKCSCGEIIFQCSCEDADKPVTVREKGCMKCHALAVSDALTKAAGSDEVAAPKLAAEMLAQRVKAAMSDAHDWMHEHSEQKNLTHTQRAACRMHRDEMHKCLKMMGEHEDDDMGRGMM